MIIDEVRVHMRMTGDVHMMQMVSAVQTNRKAIAITFDDGPVPIYTTELLEIFRAHGAKATFFVIGTHLEQYPEIAKAIYDEGHELGNHTYSHPHMTAVTKEQQRAELADTAARIKSITGQTPQVFRPPYLDFDEGVARVCEEFGYPALAGVNLDSRDWDQPGVLHIVDTVRRSVKNGAVLLLHDGAGDCSQTVAAMRVLVPELIEQGYSLITASELLALQDDGNPL
jgi:peptidoglycan/xylan/chitin deacetylase (PgdA/CDA1 family)